MIRTIPAVLFVSVVAACGGDQGPAPHAEDTTALVETIAQIAAPACGLMNASSQEAAARPSPLDSATTQLGAGTVKVCYGAPSARGRTIVGGVDPFGQPWRMGANEATVIHTTAVVNVGGVALAAGSYSLYSIPEAQNWTVVLNSSSDRWGVPINDEVRSSDIGQFTVAAEATSEHVETLRYRFEPRSEGAAELVMEFENTRIRIPIQTAE